MFVKILDRIMEEEAVDKNITTGGSNFTVDSYKVYVSEDGQITSITLFHGSVPKMILCDTLLTIEGKYITLSFFLQKKIEKLLKDQRLKVFLVDGCYWGRLEEVPDDTSYTIEYHKVTNVGIHCIGKALIVELYIKVGEEVLDFYLNETITI